DVLHRRMLDRLLLQFGIKDLPEDTTRSLNLAWHRLDAWADVNAGFARLANNFLLTPVSNANISLMADLARRNQLRFDAILGSEIAGDYKPKPRVYLAAAEAFDLPPGWYLRPRIPAISLEQRLLAFALPVSPDRTNLVLGLPNPFQRSRLMW